MADALRAAGARVLRNGTHPSSEPDVLVYNLLEPDAPERLIEDAFAREKDLSLLVCNAGSFFDTPFLEMDRDRFAKTIQLNVQQAYFLVQGFARRLVKAGRPGAVVIVSSTNGFQSEEDSTAYDISKGALVMMTRTLAQALAPHGIRVNGIAPGLIRTPLTSALGFGDKAKHYEKKIFLKRLGEPDDCAGAAVFLLSPASAYIVGQVVVVDGGLTVGQIGRM